MKIRFLGAAGDVTGSAYYVTTRKAAVLIDCGLYQGGRDAREKNRRKARLEGGRLDAVVITHCHLDHIGRLPLLIKAGYKGPIYATRPTFEIGALILRDALYLQNAASSARTRAGCARASSGSSRSTSRATSRACGRCCGRWSTTGRSRSRRASARGWWTRATSSARPASS